MNPKATRNTFFLIKLILLQTKQKAYQTGFTLVELLVVIIILGILAAVSMPNYLNQVGKARETEATNFLGSLARSQQAYHYENNTFAPTMNALTLNINLNPDYYSFPDPSSADANVAIHTAIPVDAIKYNIKNYSAGIYQNAGNFAIALCQGNAVSQTVNAPNTVSGTCTNGGIRLK